MTQSKHKYENLNIKKLEKSQVEITASIPSSVWEKTRNEALKNLNNTVTLDGFRKGNIPENILIAKIGEMAVLEEMAELILPKVYVDIVIDNKIDAIGRPNINVTKLAKGNPLEFKAVTAVMPEISLPDYKKISGDVVTKNSKIDETVTDKELEEAILRIRKMHVSHEGHDHDKMTPEEHEKSVMDNLPELTDDFVKKIGNFENVPDFKNKLSKMISEDKIAQAKEKIRLMIADKIADETKVEIPDLMVKSELSRTEAQFSADLERMGVKMEDYLKHAKKSLEDLKKEWTPHAEKKAKLQLILNSISDKEKIKPTKEEIEGEVKHITQHYKDADIEKATTYAETVLTNEKVFEFLERTNK